MSADSPRRSVRSGGLLVRPQPVSDKSVMETVVDFIQDVAYSHTGTSTSSNINTKAETREKIQWVKFEKADINDVSSNPDYNGNTVPPLLLAVGYVNGAQIWTVPASGEAQEVISLRQGPVRFLRVLHTPQQVFDKADVFAKKRPLLAVCDASSAGRSYCVLKMVSLRTAEDVHHISFEQPLADFQCSDRVLAASYQEMIRVFDACQFTELFRINACFPAPGPNANPLALGSRWLAYADKQLITVHQSCGGMSGDGGQSYAATVISAAKTISKGLAMFSDTVTSTLTGTKNPAAAPARSAPPQQWQATNRPGVVTVLDVQAITHSQVSVREDSDGEGLIAHFPAHATEPLVALQFDPSDSLLLTADRLGHNFHVYRLMAHPLSCSLGAVHHLYTLHRGDTTARVQDLAFSVDSRWVAISTLRGTTHVFPITPYGGCVTVRTHMSPRVVNRASRFHRSAGLDEMSTGRSSIAQRDSPHGSPSSSPSRHDHMRHLVHHNALNSHLCNPRLPPYPHPTTITALVQIRQSLSLPGLGCRTGGTSGGGAGRGKGQAGQGMTASAAPPADAVCVSAYFARSRGWLAGGSPNISSRDRTGEEPQCVDSLYLLNKSGELIEYVLEPQRQTGVDKPSDDAPIQLHYTARARWCLARLLSSPELCPPLSSSNALMLAGDTGQKSAALLNSPVSRQESRESLSSDHSSSDLDPDPWLSQVEIITHCGPHRRLWMGPQFSFKTFQGCSTTTTVYPSNSSVLLSHSPDTSTLDDDLDLQSLKIAPRSNPVAMPGQSRSHASSPAPTFIEASEGSYEQSPLLVEAYPSLSNETMPRGNDGTEEEQLKEDIADAMAETPAPGAGRMIRARRELDHGSMETLSTSSGSASSSSRPHCFDARCSPTHTIEHVLVFPSNSGSPDSS